MTTIIVEQPNNDIMVGMSEHNPYKDCEHHVSEDPAVHRVYFGPLAVYINSETLENAVRLQNYAQVILIVCAVDFFMALLNFVLFMNVLFFVVGLFNLLGYHGVMYFNKIELHIYSLYQLFLSVLSFFVLWYFINNGSVVHIIVSSLGIIFHTWMFKIVRNFICMFPV